MNANSGARVLVVDDSNTIRMSAKEILEGVGHRVAVAENGLEALSVLAEFDPNIILTDIMMPKVDGFELISLLRMHPKLATVPVVVFSSRTGAFDVARGALLGCVGYVAKPFASADLLGMVAEHVRRDEPVGAVT